MKIYCHPDNADLFRSRFAAAQNVPKNPSLLSPDIISPNLFGIEVHFSERVPKTSSQPTGKLLWHEGGYFPPEDRFITYEEKDLAWLRPLGFVKVEMVDTPVFWELNI